MKPLQKPRSPIFKGTEIIPWGNVNKSFNTFITIYCKKYNIKQKPKQFKDCTDDMKKWISNHSLLGNPKSNTFSLALVLPIVNPNTGKLNMGAIRSAKVYINRVKGITDKTIKDTKKLLDELYIKYFKEEDIAKESLMDIIDILEIHESKKEIISLIKRDPYVEYILDGLSDTECVSKLKSMLL